MHILKFGKAPEGDIDRALQLLRSAVDDVGVETSQARKNDPLRVVRLEQRDHRTECASDDLGDQLERMIRTLSETDERDIRPFPCRHRGYLVDPDLAGDHVVTEAADHACEELEAVGSLIRNQNAKAVCLVHAPLPGPVT
jgi:hypothetical protein